MTGPGRLRLAALAGGALAAVLGAAPAAAAPTTSTQSVGGQASVVITSVGPDYATPGGKVTVSGLVVNPTATALPGPLSVQLWSSSTPLLSQAAMATYQQTTGSGLDTQVAGAQVLLTSPVAAHGTQAWSVTVAASRLGMSAFGVYPLAAQLSENGLGLAAARTFLPFWPGGSQVRRLSIAWVWPLIDVPQRTAPACSALLSNELAANVAPGGRLQRLLAAGLSPAGRSAQLTWAIDPALISDVSVLTKPYQVDGSTDCDRSASHPASPAAAQWLRQVRSVAAHQDFFVTPYDDPDIAALSRVGLDTGVPFADGRSVGQQLLGAAQRPAPPRSGAFKSSAGQTRSSASGATGLASTALSGASRSVGWIAWPPDGAADYGLLENLAADQVHTVILNSGVMPPAGSSTSVPSAATTFANGLGGQMNVLLADQTLTKVVSSAGSDIPGLSASTAPGSPLPPTLVNSSPALRQAAEFAQEQQFLAQTAMLTAQAPFTPHSAVVAPNRRWDPPGDVAATMLKQTVTAPWLRPVSIASLVGWHPQRRQAPPSKQVSPGELRRSLLRQVAQVGALAQLEGSILTPPVHDYLDTALAAVESSAWRGGPGRQHRALALLHRVNAYVSGQLSRVRIVSNGRVALAGKSGFVPVTIQNGLAKPVTVGLRVSVPTADRVKIGSVRKVVQVAAGEQMTVKVPVQANLPGSTTLTMWLTTPAGQTLSAQPATLTVEATQFGTFAIVIIGVALLVFLVTAVTRAIRRGGGRPAAAGPTADDPAEDDPNPASPVAEPATVEAQATDDAHSPKGFDDHASTPGRPGQTGPARRG